MSSSLRVDFCSHAAARYACEHWHYSQKIPVGRLVKLGVWEDGRYIGAMIFGDGMLGSGKTFMGVDKNETAELVRVALDSHHAPVTQMVAIAVRLLRKHCPRLSLLVSFADPGEGHHGGIYQAGNWVYTGQTATTRFYRHIPTGKVVHERYVDPRGWRGTLGGRKARAFLPGECEVVKESRKHRYLLPLTNTMRTWAEQYRKPYPKRPGGGPIEGPALPERDRRCEPDPAAPTHQAERVHA